MRERGESQTGHATVGAADGALARGDPLIPHVRRDRRRFVGWLGAGLTGRFGHKTPVQLFLQGDVGLSQRPRICLIGAEGEFGGGPAN